MNGGEKKSDVEKEHRIKEERNEQQLFRFCTKNNHQSKEILDVFCTYCFYYEIFNSSHNVSNLSEVTKLIISQRRHSHPNLPLLKITENLPAPNTAPEQRRCLRFFIINLHFTAVWWMSL